MKHFYIYSFTLAVIPLLLGLLFIWFGKTFEWTFALNMIKRNFIMRKKQEGNNI